MIFDVCRSVIRSWSGKRIRISRRMASRLAKILLCKSVSQNFQDIETFQSPTCFRNSHLSPRSVEVGGSSSSYHVQEVKLTEVAPWDPRALCFYVRSNWAELRLELVEETVHEESQERLKDAEDWRFAFFSASNIVQKQIVLVARRNQLHLVAAVNSLPRGHSIHLFASFLPICIN